MYFIKLIFISCIPVFCQKLYPTYPSYFTTDLDVPLNFASHKFSVTFDYFLPLSIFSSTPLLLLQVYPTILHRFSLFPLLLPRTLFPPHTNNLAKLLSYSVHAHVFPPEKSSFSDTRISSYFISYEFFLFFLSSPPARKGMGIVAGWSVSLCVSASLCLSPFLRMCVSFPKSPSR